MKEVKLVNIKDKKIRINAGRNCKSYEPLEGVSYSKYEYRYGYRLECRYFSECKRKEELVCANIPITLPRYSWLSDFNILGNSVCIGVSLSREELEWAKLSSEFIVITNDKLDAYAGAMSSKFYTLQNNINRVEDDLRDKYGDTGFIRLLYHYIMNSDNREAIDTFFFKCADTGEIKLRRCNLHPEHLEWKKEILDYIVIDPPVHFLKKRIKPKDNFITRLLKKIKES